MKNLKYMIDPILHQIFRTTLSISSRRTIHWLITNSDICQQNPK